VTKRSEDKPKIGAGHAGAMVRKGLEELRASVYPGSNVAQPSNYGLYGTLTPGEVAEAKHSLELNRDEEPARDSVLADRLAHAERDQDRGMEPKQPEMER
jgi:hypothetical protein